MRKLPLFLLIFFVQCTSPTKKETNVMTADKRNDTASILQQYWLLEDADHPLAKDVINKEDKKDYMPGIVFIDKTKLLENPGGMTARGTYTRNGNDIDVSYDDGTKATYTIKILNTDTLFVERTLPNDNTNILYKATNSWWPDLATNPFTKENFAWTIKPAKPETESQIKDRCRDFIRFYQYYLEGFVRGDADKINFVGLPNIFNWYSGGIGLQSDKNLNPKWVDCFYNDDEAFQGYTMIRHVILKKFDWDANEANWMKQSARVLKQMRDSL